MRFILTILLCMGGYSNNSFAIPNICHDIADGLLEKSTQADDLESLMKQFESIKKSPDRLVSEKYAAYHEVLTGVIRRLNEKRDPLSKLVDTNSAEYKRDYSTLSRWFGEGSKYYKDKVRPFKQEITAIDRILNKIVPLADQVASAQKNSSTDPLIFEADLIFSLAYADYSSSTSMAFAKSLLGKKGELNKLIEDAHKVYSIIYDAIGNKDVVPSLTSTLISANKTDGANISKIIALFRSFEKEYSLSVSTTLAIAAFVTNHKSLTSKKIMKFYEEIYERDDVGSKAAASMTFAYSLKGGDYKTELEKLVSIYNDVYKFEKSVEKSSAILATAIYLRNDSKVDATRAYRLQQSLYGIDGVGWSEAAALASAVVLRGGKSEDIKVMKDIFEKCYETSVCETSQAVSLASTVILRRDNIDIPELGGVSVEVFSSSGTDMMTSMAMYNLATGGGVDGNIATPF